MRQYLVEIYSAEGADPAALDGLAEGSGVRYLRSIVIPDDQTCLHLVLAASVEDVESAFARVGLPTDRVVDAVGLPELTAENPVCPKSPGE
jgi:hypothetical protein